MLISILSLVAGLAMILVGANALTDGASSLAARLGVSRLVIGLTVVAFGTSAPELAVNIVSAVEGNAGMAIGNVVGSNMFNMLMIVGVTAMAVPRPVTKNTLSKEMPLALLSCVVLFICADDILLGSGDRNIISRADGLLLLCFFAVFMGYTFAIAKDNADLSDDKTVSMPMWRSVVYIVAGLGALIWGGELFVGGAGDIARSLGVDEATIGLTLVAMGTSLPELATSVVAAVKKNPEIAVGNVIGSTLFNSFFVLGASAVISPLPLNGITLTDLLSLIGASVLMLLAGRFGGKRVITRPEGAVLVAAYVGYMVYLVMR